MELPAHGFFRPMKHFTRYLIAILLLAGTQLMAQSRHQKLGDERYNRLAYAKAIPHYKKAIKKTPENVDLVYRLAHSYYLIRDFSGAEAWYTKLMQMEGIPAESHFEYGHVLLQQKRYQEAKSAFAKYQELKPADERGGRFAEALANMKSWYRDSAAYFVENLPFNSRSSDFGAVRFRDGVVFASSRPAGTPTDLIYEGLNAHFLNLYYVKLKDETANNWGNPDMMKGGIRTRFHESSFTVDTSGTLAFFSRNNFLDGKKGKNDAKTILLKIYSLEIKGDKVGNIAEFPFNDDAYSLTHPSISPDGRHLYFSSDMPGGAGGKDIYVSHRQGESWSKPENLGPAINTSGNEVFPFIAQDGNFYFASDGHPGIGNLDIFQTRLSDKGSKIRNIGAPINSEFDDFAIFWNPGNETGYFSSNRPGGEGDDDIYRFKMELPTIQIFVKDSVSQFPIEKAELVLSDTNGVLIASQLTDSTGRGSFKVALANHYRIKVKTLEFDDYDLLVDPQTESGASQFDYYVTLYNPPPAITAHVIDEGSKTAIPNAKIALRRYGSPDTIFRQSDRFGRFSVKLNPNSQYELMVQKEGYFAFKSELSTSRDGFEGDTLIPMRLEPVELDKPMILANIHYDFDKWELREEAMAELFKLGILLEDNPKISIELGAHTDARGSDTYNQKLSERRAKSARNFLISLGISGDRIAYSGYGESQPINECSNGVKCSERQHFANRRTEFTIIGYEGKIIHKPGLPNE